LPREALRRLAENRAPAVHEPAGGDAG
jgi:hypothetical protein